MNATEEDAAYRANFFVSTILGKITKVRENRPDPPTPLKARKVILLWSAFQ